MSELDQDKISEILGSKMTRIARPQFGQPVDLSPVNGDTARHRVVAEQFFAYDARLETLTAQRDALLEACKGLNRNIEGDEFCCCPWTRRIQLLGHNEACTTVREAIALATTAKPGEGE